MSNEKHETIDDIVKEMRENAKHNHAIVEVYKYLTEIADRIEAAHKREIAELRKGISELLDALQAIYDEECTSYGTEEVYYKWRKALKGASND